MKKRYNTMYKCPFCDSRYNRSDLVDHVVDKHDDEIPDGYTATRVVYDYVNKKPAGYNGKCTECGGPTRWDENKGRYDRQCSNPKCKESYLKRFEENMVKKTGHKRISETEEGQKKMLANRKISGYYTFRDGTKKSYCGSYERKALEFMDKILEINSYDIMCPGPILKYKLDDKTHMYITDFYYIPYNLIIEVKDGGDNPNTRNMPEYRAKQIAKEKYIIENTNYNYIRLTDNKLNQLISVFADLKMQLVDDSNERVVHVNESVANNKYRKIEITAESIKNVDKKYTKHLRINNNSTGYLYYDNENFIGVINTEIKDSKEIWITALEVASEYKRQGIGTFLLKEAEKIGAKFLSVNKSNKAAINLYKSNGWRIYNETDTMYFMKKVIHVNESLDPIHEFMNGLTAGRVPGISDSDAYIVNYTGNKVFAGEPSEAYTKYAVSKGRNFNSVIAIDKDGVVSKLVDFKPSKPKVYKLDKSIEEISNALSSIIGTSMTDKQFYEAVTGSQLLFDGQIDKQFTRVDSIEEYSNRLHESVKEYLLEETDDDIIKLEKSINEVKSWISIT